MTRATQPPLTFGSLFSGIGGIDLGFERAGMVCKWQVEIDPFCQRVLAKHWPNVARYSDVREVGKHNLEPVDVICGGFPCQDVSLAGERAGLEGKRSTLWTQYARIIGEIKPRWVLAENVPGLFTSDDGQFFGNILNDLAEIGYDAEWSIVSACSMGAPHTRERVLIVAHPIGKLGIDTRIRGIYGNTQNKGAEEGQRGAHRQFTSVGTETTAGLYSERAPWECEPRILRVVDGVPDRLDRLKSLGNAVVPQVAEWIARRIVEASQC